LVCHPLDTIRTRLQASALASATTNFRPYTGAIDCLQRTVIEEGALALYRGMAAPFFAQAVYKAVMFGSFGIARDSVTPALLGQGAAERSPRTAAFVCGCFAGSVNTLVLTPVELVRNRLMVQRRLLAGQTSTNTNRTYGGILDVVKTAVREGGVSSLWRGLSSTILRDGPGVGVWFAAFETSKRGFPSLMGWAADSTANLLLSGAAGGIGFWLVALPFDAIKSHIQTAALQGGRPENPLQVANRVGIRGLYTGLGIALFRGIPGAGIVFLVQSRASAWLETKL
jgi:solute carrier family 25 carnitine/acylcarnitine transporter 20/29